MQFPFPFLMSEKKYNAVLEWNDMRWGLKCSLACTYTVSPALNEAVFALSVDMVTSTETCTLPSARVVKRMVVIVASSIADDALLISQLTPPSRVRCSIDPGSDG